MPVGVREDLIGFYFTAVICAWFTMPLTLEVLNCDGQNDCSRFDTRHDLYYVVSTVTTITLMIQRSLPASL